MTSWGTYVGRVGGLAVALGIGAAIATGQGVASADSSAPPSEPGSSEAPKPPPSSSDVAADGAGSVEGGTERKRLSVPSLRPWSGQGHRKAVDGSDGSRLTRHLFTDNDSRPGKRWASTTGIGAPASEETKLLDQDADELTLTPEGPWKMSGGADDTDPPLRRSSLSSRHSAPNALERWRNRGELASDTEAKAPSISVHNNAAGTGGPAVDGRTFAAEIGAVDSATPTAVDVQPLIARAAPTAEIESSIITRLLSPLGFGAQATDTPLAPVSPTSIMGVFELVRRELERFFDNKTPSFTYTQNAPANGVITGKLVGTDPDPDSTLTYTATSPAEGDVVIGPDGTFTFAPNDTYDGSASFSVTISDESSGFHVHGLSGVLNLVTFGLIGESGHTHTQTVKVSGEVPPPDFERKPWVEGLTQPIDFRFLPRVNETAPDRILFAEKGGEIKVYNGSGVQTLTTLPVETHWARGINGIEVDPDFNTNGYIYVSYIRNDTDPTKDGKQRLSRFEVTDPTADVLTIDPTTERVLIQGTEPAGDDHHGGEIRYIDGKLYYATGDNICCSTIDGSRSQDLTTMYGKVLRINPDGTVPTDNPYYDGPKGPNYDAIYAQGLRNPFRGGVTPDGQMVVGDVGQNTWEEINLVTRGANFGWPYAEGVCPDPGICNNGSSGKTNPIHAYEHEGSDGSSITSVLVYDGDAFGERYENAVFFADFNRGFIKVVNCNEGYTSCGSARTFIPAAGNTTRLAQGPDGSIYQLTIDGTLWRIAPSDETLTV